MWEDKAAGAVWTGRKIARMALHSLGEVGRIVALPAAGDADDYVRR